MKTIFFLISILVFFTACKKQDIISIKHVNNIKQGELTSGYFYYLPQTVISFEIIVEKTEFIPGPYAKYAEKYLSINTSQKASTSYRIVKTSISSYPEPDPTQYYYIEYNPEKNSPLLSISLTNNGLLKSVNSKISDVSFTEHQKSQEYGYFGTKTDFYYLLDSNLKEIIDTIYENHWVDTAIVQRQRLVRSLIEKPTETKAKELSEHILDIRNKQNLLITGFSEIPYSKETLQYMYEEMGNIERNYLKLFEGFTATTYIKYNYSFLPLKEHLEAQDLFRFSDDYGLLPTDSDYGFPVTIDVSTVQELPQLRFFSFNTGPVSGFYYRIPEEAYIKVLKGKNIIADDKLLISQFGKVKQLPTGNFEIIFYPETGSIKSIRKIRD